MKGNLPVCHLCGENSVRKHGLARSGFQRYYCTSCKKTFQVRYIYLGHETNIFRQVKALLQEGKSRVDISRQLGVSQGIIDRQIYLIAIDEDESSR
ncbi:MAG: IS1 family transposase [Budvicia sp.]|nr:IS1 family transposase [Budvicia sp.]